MEKQHQGKWSPCMLADGHLENMFHRQNIAESSTVTFQVMCLLSVI